MVHFGKNRQASIDPEVPQSLEGVINSLETLLERREHEVPEAIQESLESFADSMDEQHDDPLVPESSNTLETQPVEIPVLNDIVSRGKTSEAEAIGQLEVEQAGAELDILLDALRSELDNLVEDILDDARDRFTQILDNAAPAEDLSQDNLNDFMRDALKRHGSDN